MHGVFGTGYYCSPEVIHGDYSEKCDVWSIGVIFYMLLCGQPPFKGNSGKEVLDSVMKGDYSTEGPIWQSISPAAK